MSKITPNVSLVEGIHGKASHKHDGYFYVTSSGKQYYRKREEDYQCNQSPRQKWNSAAFRHAHQTLHNLLKDPESAAAILAEWKEAKRLDRDGATTYATPERWKFVQLQSAWKTDHPYDAWYADYVTHLRQVSEEKTATGKVSKSTIEEQIDLLTEQLISLRQQLKEREH